MKIATIGLPNSPPVCVHSTESEAELLEYALKNHPWIKDEFDRIPDGLHIAGLTVGTSDPAIHVYIAGNLEPLIKKETVIHEALHATNCVLRWRAHGSMERNKLLIIADSSSILIPTFESMNISIEGVDEEDQALLVSQISIKIEECLDALKTASEGPESNG